MKKSKYNIEYGHIYSDKLPGNEQASSFGVLRKYVATLGDKNDIVTTVLFDDYSPVTTKQLPDTYLRHLRINNVVPSFFVLESQVADYFPKVVEGFAKKDVRSAFRFEEKTNKFPCAFLVAIWNLIRLGVVPLPKDFFWVTNTTQPFASFYAVSILPKKYLEVEERAMRYILNSKYKSYLSRVIHKYF